MQAADSSASRRSRGAASEAAVSTFMEYSPAADAWSVLTQSPLQVPSAGVALVEFLGEPGARPAAAGASLCYLRQRCVNPSSPIQPPKALK